jgi:hypothetical protein
MVFNIKIFLLCPIPEDQKPIKQLINLKENSFTKVLTLSNKEFLKKSFFNFFCVFLILSFFRSNQFNSFLLNINWLLINIEISLTFLVLSIYFSFNQWNTLVDAFNSPRIFYEEASWFDGQIWDKPFSIIKNDRLIIKQQLKPLLKRTINVLVFLIFFIFSIFLLLEFLKIN